MTPRLATVWFEHYSEPWETLPACDSVDIVRQALQDQGFEHESWSDKGNHGSHLTAIRARMDALADAWKNEPEKAKLPLVLYWSGHGGIHGKDFYFILPEHPEALRGWAASELSRALAAEDQAGRRDSSDAWRLVLLDTCQSVEAIAEILGRCGGMLPAQLMLLASGPGEQPTGELARRFRRVLEDMAKESGRFTLREVVRRIADDDYSRAQGSFAVDAMWPGEPASPIQATYDDLVEFRTMLKDLPDAALRHFLPKARGRESFTNLDAELSTPPWRFVGRNTERSEVGRWLRESSGLLAVTGRAGSGKSALLGMVLASTVPGLLDALREKGCDVTQPSADPPKGFSFDAILHLSGQTVQEFIGSLVDALGLQPTERLEDMAAQVAAKYPTGVRILSDALDEAVDPIPIISGLRQLAAQPGAQVIVGTRRSLGERIDDPTRSGESLIERLTPDRTVTVERDEDAAYDYAYRTLRESEKLTEDDVRRCARAISEPDQPFLFARLAVYELLADPAKAQPEQLESLLATGHGGIFAVSFERINSKSRRTGAVVRSLAYSFGRGFPRTDGIWQTAANALYQSELEPNTPKPDPITDSDIGTALDEAGAYIMIDFEHGQSVFRLAHRTFREYFEDLDALESAAGTAAEG